MDRMTPEFPSGDGNEFSTSGLASDGLTRRRFLRNSALALAAASAPASFGASVSAQTKTDSPVLEFKFAEIQPAQGIYARYEQKFAKLVEERTKGTIKVAVFAGGALGGEKDVLEGMRVGSVHLSLIGLTLMPFLDVIWGPYVFRDNDHAKKVLQGEIGQSWKDRVLKESGGLRLLDYVYFGPRQLTTKTTPARTPAQVKGLKIRVMEAPIYLATWRALGASPVPMAWPEVFTGLQQGTIDAQENPYELIVSNSLFEVQKYVMLTAHITQNQAIVINEKFYQGLSPEHRKILTDAAYEAGTFQNELVLKSEKEYLDKLKEKGMSIVQPDLKAFREATKDVYKKFAEKWEPGLYEKIQAVK